MRGSISGCHGLAGILLATLACTQSSSSASTLPRLEITGVSNDVVYLVLQGTEPHVTYEVQSKEDLTRGWEFESLVVGTEGFDRTTFQVAKDGRTNALFLRTRCYPAGNMDGVPLSDLQLWLKADAGVVCSAGTASVSVWQDQSGNGNDAIGQTPYEPEYVGSALNDHPVIRFDAANLEFLNLPDFLSGNTAGELFVVLKTRTNAPTRYRGPWQLGSVTGGYYPASAGAGGHISGTFGRCDALLNTGVPAQRVDEYHLYNASTATGEWSSRVNGAVHHATDNGTPSFTTTPVLGKNRYSGQGVAYFDGDMAELLVFNRVLTSGERDLVGEYLNRKYHWLTHVPAAPTNLTATGLAPDQVIVSWANTLRTETTVYTIERKTGTNGTYAEVAEVRDATSYLDTGVSGNCCYHYRLKAWNYAGESAYSGEVNATTPFEGIGLPFGGMQLWLKADAGVVRAGPEGAVKLWRDQSGNGNDASNLTVYQPEHIESAINGHPAIRFDAANLEFLNLPDFLSGNTAGELFVVLKASTNAPSGYHGPWHLGSAEGGYYPSSGGSGGYISASFGRSAVVMNTGAPAQRVDEYHLYNASSALGEWRSRLNGSPHYSTDNGPPSFTPTPVLGKNRYSGQGTRFFDGNMAEVIVFDRVLNQGERDAVAVYLNARYDLVDLPTGEIHLFTQALSGTQTALSWRQSGIDETNAALYAYTIERRPGTNGTFLSIGQVNGITHYEDGDCAPDTLYTYRVRNSHLAPNDHSNESVVTTTRSDGRFPLDDVAVWLNATDLAETNSTPLEIWNDFWVPDQAATQTEVSLRPIWLSTGLEGLPAVRFGGGSYLALPSVLSNATSAEAFVVLKASTNTPSANLGLWRFNNSGATFFPDTNGAIQDAFGSGLAHASLAPFPELTNALIYSVSADSSRWQSRMNGPLKQWVTNNDVEFDGVPLLGRSTGGSPEAFAGNVAELIIFNRALSLEEQKAVRDGLALKYGLTLELPEIPDNLSLSKSNTTDNLLTWTALTGSENGLESYFWLERRADRNGAFHFLETTHRTASGYLDETGLPDMSYGYRLWAVNDAGSVASEILVASDADADGDGLSDRVEAMLGTDPDDSDSDDDGLPDDWEVEHGLNPLRADAIHGASGDFDKDGVSNLDEYQNGTNPADGVAGEDPHIRLRLHRPN